MNNDLDKREPVNEELLEQIKKRRSKDSVLKVNPDSINNTVDIPDTGEDLSLKLFKTFGTVDRDAAKGFLEQLAQIHPDLNQENGAEVLNKITPILHGIGPQDELETMLALQAIAVHGLAMEMAKRAARDSSPQATDSNLASVVKLTRTFTAQMEALGKYRNRGKQKMTVKHIHVNSGGQAIVGDVNRGGSGE